MGEKYESFYLVKGKLELLEAFTDYYNTIYIYLVKGQVELLEAGVVYTYLVKGNVKLFEAGVDDNYDVKVWHILAEMGHHLNGLTNTYSKIGIITFMLHPNLLSGWERKKNDVQLANKSKPLNNFSIFFKFPPLY